MCLQKLTLVHLASYIQAGNPLLLDQLAVRAPTTHTARAQWYGTQLKTSKVRLLLVWHFHEVGLVSMSPWKSSWTPRWFA